MLFQGEEFAASSPFQYFTHHGDPELARAVSEGRRGEFSAFGWEPEDVPDPQEFETLQRSKLPWDEINRPPHDEILAWYKQLIALRRSNSQLTDGNLEAVQIRCDEPAHWFVMRRGEFEVVCNLAPERQAIPVTRTSKNVLASQPDYEFRPESIELPPDSVAIIM